MLATKREKARFSEIRLRHYHIFHSYSFSSVLYLFCEIRAACTLEPSGVTRDRKKVEYGWSNLLKKHWHLFYRHNLHLWGTIIPFHRHNFHFSDTISILQALLEKYDESTLETLVIRYVQTRDYYNTNSCDDPIRCWSDEEDEREKKRESTSDEHRSRTLAPSNVDRIIERWELLIYF